MKVIDSFSKDDSRSVAELYGFEVCQIDQKDFDHGGTRYLALSDGRYGYRCIHDVGRTTSH